MKKIRLLFLTLVALIGAVSASASKTVYIQPNAWSNDGAVISLWIWGGSNAGSWWTESNSLTEVESGIFKATFDDEITSMKITRGKVGNTWTAGNDAKWNESGNITFTSGKLYKLYDYDSSMDGIYVGHGIVEEDYSEPVLAGYTVDFNTSIATSNREFAIASNWAHVSGYDANYDSNMSYNYSETAGVDKTGALLAYRQYKYDWGQSSNGVDVYDLLITPQVKGKVSIAIKQYSGSNSFIEFYEMTDNGDGTFTRGNQIAYTLGDGESLSQSTYATASISVADFTRIGIRASYMYLDNFAAQEANIIPESAITIVSADPTATTGTIYWDQQANGKVLVKYTITVKNTGDVDLTQGTDGYSVSIFNRTTDDVYSTTPVPQNLAVGATSDPFVVQAEVDPSIWVNAYTYYSMDLRENLKGTVMQRAQSRYNAYESKFVFRKNGTTSTSSISSAESWGTISESTTYTYEILNNGSAPLVIKSISLPTGFTSTDVPEIPVGGLTIEGKNSVTFNLTQDATVVGTFAGSLEIEYVNYGSEDPTQYTLAFSATVIGANTWTSDFNNTKSGIVYPEGSVAQGGINSDYDYNSGNYNYWITGRTSSSYAEGNNMFITPKLHANAGDKLAFDVKGAYNASYFAKVYVSTDRKSWNQVAYYTQNETAGAEAIGYSNWYTKTISFEVAGDYYVAFALYGTFKIDNLVGLEKVDVAHDLYIKEVSWPDASIKSGTAQTKPSVTIIPLTNEDAANYTVKYICGTTVLGEGTSKALNASATSSTEIAINWTPNVTETTAYPETKVVIEFTDGTKFETETFDLTVTNEPIFHFLNAKPSSKWYEPTDRTADITFGKTSTADTQSFVIFNWGSANLNVKSISLPAGFSTTTEFPLVVTAFNGENDGIDASSQALDITFSAAEAGNYSGDMVITYVNGAGEDATFQLPIRGTKLDPTLFYANFDDGGWPAGSIYQGSVSSTNGGTYSAPNYYISSSSTTNNLFITPKLTAQAGDKLLFDAKLYNSSWSEGKVVVYAAATRDELVNFDPEADTRTKLFSVSGEDAENPMTIDYQTFEVPAVAGDNYYAFEISGYPYVDELYGLKVADVAHDWTIASSNIPTEGMQNKSYTASVNLLNLGIADEAAENMTVKAFVGGEAVATTEGVAIPMSHQLTAAGTELSVSFIYPKTGTVPVYLKVASVDGTYSVQTNPVNVTFAEEVASGDAIEVGSSSGADRNHGPVDWYSADGSTTNWTDIVYTADELKAFGITAGSKITSIAFKGNGSSKSIKAKVTSWVGTKTGDITPGTVDKASMTEVSVYDQTDDAATIDFSEMVLDISANPIVFDGTSDIRIYTETVGQGYGNWQTVNYAYDNNYMTSYNNSSTAIATPLGYFTLAPQTGTLSGTVKTSVGDLIGGATVTLKADNGVEYSGTTAADGSYSINVIQAGLVFTATVEKDGYLKKQFALNMGGASKTNDVVMYTKMGIVGDAGLGLGWDTDHVMTQSTENPNIFTLTVEGVGIDAGTFEYKLRADGAWNLTNKYELPNSGNNNFVFGTTMYPAGTYNLIFTANTTDHTLTLQPVLQLTLANSQTTALNYENAPADVTVARTLKAGWNAMVLPFDVTAEEIAAQFGANAQVAEFTGDNTVGDNVEVNFEKKDVITANVPFLLYLEAAPGEVKFLNKSVTFAAEPKVAGKKFDFVGLYADGTSTTIADGDYIMAGGMLKCAAGGNDINAYRSYLKLKEAPQPARISIFLDGELIGEAEGTGEATGIQGIGVKQAEGLYNMGGQKVTGRTKKGVYIQNGKKVVIK